MEISTFFIMFAVSSFKIVTQFGMSFSTGFLVTDSSVKIDFTCFQGMKETTVGSAPVAVSVIVKFTLFDNMVFIIRVITFIRFFN